MKYWSLSKFVALLVALCFGIVLPTHNHADHQVCDFDGQNVSGDHIHIDHDEHDSDGDHHDAPGDNPHRHHTHHCSVCFSFSSYAYLTAAPLPPTSLDLLGHSTLPRPPTPYVESTAHTHLGRDPPSLI